jgi:quercetin dioxygenase-like cupin family protein
MATETFTKPYRVRAGDGLADVWWKGGRVAVKTSGGETRGRFAQVEIEDTLGTGPPLHVHRDDDESFYVVAGEVTVLANGERIDLSPGDFALVPAGVPHAYVVRSERSRMLVTFGPAGFEEFFVELGIPVNGSEPPADGVYPSPEGLARRIAAYGGEILGPPPKLGDLRKDELDHAIANHDRPGDAWIVELFDEVDSLDATAFAHRFTVDGSFRFANNPAAVGNRQVEQACAAFFSMLGGLSHEITGIWSGTWEGGEVKSVESNVTYTRKNGAVTPPLPATSTIRLRGELIEDFRVFVDLASVFTPGPE